MAERDEFQKQYGYNAMSNKVQQIDPALRRRQRNEPTGEVETLAGRTDIGRMGDRVIQSQQQQQSNDIPKKSKLDKKTSSNDKKRGTDKINSTSTNTATNSKKKRISSLTNDMPGLADDSDDYFLPSNAASIGTNNNGRQLDYQPTNDVTKDAYRELLSFLSSNNKLFAIANQGTGVLYDAANEILAILKDDTTIQNDLDKQYEISILLTGTKDILSKENFTKLVQIGKVITDYGILQNSNIGMDKNSNDNDNDEENDLGVAVVFDDDNDNGNDDNGDGGNADSDIDQNVVADSESSSDDDDDDDNVDKRKSGMNIDENDSDFDDINPSNDNNNRSRNNNNKKDKTTSFNNDNDSEGNSDDYDDTTTDNNAGGSRKKRSNTTRSDRIVSVHEIDAHYIQRQLSNYYQDPGISAAKATEVFSILDITTTTTTTSTGTSNNNETNAVNTNNSNSTIVLDARECQNKLLVTLGFDLFDIIRLFEKNRIKIWAIVALKRSSNDIERTRIHQALLNESTGEGKRIYDEIVNNSNTTTTTSTMLPTPVALIGSKQLLSETNSVKKEDVTKAIDSVSVTTTIAMGKGEGGQNTDTPMSMKEDEATELNLDILTFKDGVQNVTKKCVLPDTSYRVQKKGYEEVYVPAVRSVIPKDEKLIVIQEELPKWTHTAFQGMDKLNRIQSKLCNVALTTSENLLLCAPTGAGKTNVACLAMLNILGQYRINDDENNNNENENEIDNDEQEQQRTKPMFDLNAFKIVYVAPMKALVQEVVLNFSNRFAEYGITVAELSGDSSLTRQQITETQVLVTTPEKWDIITRQGDDRAYTQLVRLLIIDEIHLLHDDRGPVLEGIIARSIRQVETTAEPIRLVGLSATLPNYNDVATLLRVKPDKGLFVFDHSYRPVPLQMQYIGITERSALKRFQLQNDICYEKSLDQRKYNNQLLIFVHSRAETAKTAKALRDIAIAKEQLSPYFVKDGSATQEILREEAANAKSADLKNVLSYGFAIHHAGMVREDRELVEALFAERHIAVLCCTATLAWGVNLPAHAVIIRGTQIYNPELGRWAELSPLDIMQMLGRAGRPQYDSEGEGIIITQHSQLQYYLSLTNIQLPVESQLIKSLPEHMNAEVVLGSIQTMKEAVDWLGYSFLYVRMLQNPALYGISELTIRNDPTLKQRRLDLAHTAATILEKCHLVRYDQSSRSLQSTPMGRIASQYYITHTSMAVYMRNMRVNLSDIELLRLFSLSGEFSHITVREEEKLELMKLAARVPIPVKESPSEPSAKINILLQAYISRLKLEGFALVADMTFIQQSAARIMRAIFEIALKRKWSALSRLCLDMSNMIAHRIWRSQSPLRQYKNVPDIVCRKLERKSDIEWVRYFDLTPSDLGELAGLNKMGRVLHKLVHQFPRVELSAQILPMTRSMLRIELTILPAFQFDVEIHGYSQLFHIIVEDVNGEMILHHETFFLKSRDSEEEHVVVFTVPILDPLPPAYFVRVLADRWLHSSTVLPISFNNMILPAKFPPPTELLDLQPLLPSILGEKALVKIFQPYKEFNPVQTQTFHELFKTDRNCLVCAPANAGKTICASFAILRMFTSDSDGKCVYVAPTDDIADPAFAQMVSLFGSLLPKGSVTRLTGETGPDLELIQQSKVIVASVRQWDMLSRRWKQRKAVQAVTLMIFDELHFLGGELGPSLEVVISRTRFINSQLQQSEKKGIRIVGLSASLANAKDVGEWMGVGPKSLFNFSPKTRSLSLTLTFQSFEQSNYSARLMAMAKPVFASIERHADGQSVLVYVPSKRQAQLTAIDIMTYAESQGIELVSKANSMDDYITEVESFVREPALAQVLQAGIAFVHSGMSVAGVESIVSMYNKGIVRVLVCPVDLCWKVQCVAHLVIIMGTESYDGKLGRHVDYPLVDLIRMTNRHHPEKSGNKCVVLCHEPKKDYLKKLLNDPLPIESHLDSYLHDPLNSEIVSKTVSSMQDAIDYLTWTYLYRRLSKNPTYYGLRGTTNVFLSEYLSEIIETVIGDLEESKCCNVSDEGDISPLNHGMIAAYYNIQYKTIELISLSITEKAKIRVVLGVLSAAWEFSSLPIRFGEDKTMKIMSRRLTHKLPDTVVYDSNTKAMILLQYHFSRVVVPPDMRDDQKIVLKESINILQAIVDVISSSGWLKPALAAMEISQMVVQGLWNKDNVLKQIPHFTDEIIQRCQEYKGEEPIESVFDILSLDDDIRNELLQLPEDKMSNVAFFCNNYPNIDVAFTVQDPDEIVAGEPIRIIVTLEREIDDDEDEHQMTEEEMNNLGTVAAPLFPIDKKEGWWVVVGDSNKNLLLSLKRITLRQKQKIVLDFMAPDDAGDYDLSLFCMSDSYLGCDQQFSIPISVGVPQSDDEDDDDDDDDDSDNADKNKAEVDDAIKKE